MDWYFHREGQNVSLTARAEGPDEMIGDFEKLIYPGETFRGLTHQELYEADAGVMRDDGKKGKIVESATSGGGSD